MRSLNETNTFYEKNHFGAFITIFTALFIYILPWSPEFKTLLPNLPLMSVLFINRACPKKYGYFLAFFVGCIQDGLSGSLLGFNAFIYLLGWATLKFLLNRLHTTSVAQEISAVFFTFFLTTVIHIIFSLYLGNVSLAQLPILNPFMSIIFTLCLWLSFILLIRLTTDSQYDENV